MADCKPFIIYALPRSRTFWLSRFLTYGDWTCLHEPAITLRSFGDVIDMFRRPNIGVAETAAGPGWKLLRHHLPEIRSVVIRRPAEEVVQAMMRVDVAGVATYDEAKLRTGMAYGARVLDRIANEPGVLVVEHADLDREDACAAIFEHCLPYRFDLAWWESWRHQNIQTDVKRVLLYYAANRAAVEGFKRACKQELRRLAYAGLISNKAHV